MNPKWIVYMGILVLRLLHGSFFLGTAKLLERTASLGSGSSPRVSPISWLRVRVFQ